MGQRKDGKVILAFGTTGSGKTSIINHLILKDKPKRLLLWDVDGQLCKYFGAEKFTDDIRLLAKRLIDNNGEAFKVGYQAKNLRSDFKKFCELAFHLGVVAPLSVVVEELADVTDAAKANDEWGMVTRRGRKYEITTYAASQRTQEIDKTMVSNCAKFYVFQHVLPENIKSARKLIDAEPPNIPLHFIEVDIGKQWQKRYGRISFRGARPIVAYRR